MKKKVFSFYIILTVVGLTVIFLFPARGRTECDRRDLSGVCMGDSNLIIQPKETAVQNIVAGQPTLISPSGETFDTTPTYTWNAVANATWYHIWINTSTGKLGDQWYTAQATNCPTGIGTCSLSPGTVLAPGTYTWWIQAWFNAYGPWSDGKSFYIDPNGKNCQNISSAGFTPLSSSDMTFSSSIGWRWRTGGVYYWFDAPVHLPAGAQITQVFVDYYDNNATGDVFVWLFDDALGGSYTIYGGSGSSGTPGYDRLEANLIGNNIVVDNNGHSYFIRVRLEATDSSNMFRGAIICYKPSP